MRGILVAYDVIRRPILRDHDPPEFPMASISRFEDLRAWQQARRLYQMTHEITASTSFRNEWSLRSQLRRASNSTMANIAEGFSRFGRAEFCHFLSIARGSCAETESHLYAALDAKLISNDAFTEVYRQAQTVMGLITRLRTANKRNNVTGTKPNIST